MNAYYSQWDAADLDSWQGIEIGSIQENELTEEDIELLKIEQEFSPSMDDYGLCWKQFM